MNKQRNCQSYRESKFFFPFSFFFIELICCCCFRDTPHHLKNKRVSHGLSEKTANSILLNAMKMKDPVEEQPELEAMLVETNNINGK